MGLISKKFKKESRKGDFKNFTKTNFQIFGDLNFEVFFFQQDKMKKIWPILDSKF